MTAKTIARLRSMLARATPGPFVVHRYDQSDGSISYQVQSEHREPADLHPLTGAVLCAHNDGDSPRAKADAELHVEMRNTLADLLDEAEHYNTNAGCTCVNDPEDSPCPLHGTEGE